MKIKNLFLCLLFFFVFSCNSDGANIVLKKESKEEIAFLSSDTTLQNVFIWAKSEALKYVGDSNDPVGPWYEAALPGREAFCMRDVAHQCIGGEILGLSSQNLNMLLKFTSNISESKDWCSYWEINRYNLPAPVDYKNDEEFWYNLPSGLDIINACWRLYCWTGNDIYIKNDVFLNFYEKSLNEYIERWQLQPYKIMDRPRYMNLPEPFDENKDYFHICCRGLPSYVETSSFPIACSADLIASLYSGFHSYSKILKVKGDIEKSKTHKNTALEYKNLLESKWWNESLDSYQTFWSEKKMFDKGQGELFLLWFDILNKPDRIKATFSNVLNYGLNVESLSYLPLLYCDYGYYEKAYNLILALSDPSETRRTYPEVSYAIIEGIICGLMGVKLNFVENLVSSCPKMSANKWVEIKNLKVFNTNINLKHSSCTSSTLSNNGRDKIIWKVMFPEKYESIVVNGEIKAAKLLHDKLNHAYSYIEIPVQGGLTVKAEAVIK